ncbi:MAG: formate dehydrogenase subunit gamma [bacterium]
MGVEAVPRYDATPVARFSPTERRLHRIHAVAFCVLLASGTVLWLPALAQAVSDRPLVKAIHLGAAVAWLTALALVVVLGDRRALARTRRDIEAFDADDLLWLRRKKAPQGRFNAGQKVHAILQAGLGVLFTVSGVLLWLGERDTSLRFDGTIALHDAATFLGVVLVCGHMWKAYAKPESLEGMRRGTVRADYAAREHPKWRAPPAGEGGGGDRATARPGQVGLAAAVAVAGLTGIALLVSDVLG